jgi:hypothetical protein
LKNQKKLAVLATPCGGTQFINKCLNNISINTEHEQMGPDGIVCGFITLGAGRLLDDGTGNQTHLTFDQHRFDYIAHLLRHPLDVVETLSKFIDFRKRSWVHENNTISALRMWVLTHEKAREILRHHQYPAQTAILRIGTQLEDDFTRLCLMLGKNISKLPKAPKNSKSPTQRVPRIGMLEWRREDPDYASRGMGLIEDYSLKPTRR